MQTGKAVLQIGLLSLLYLLGAWLQQYWKLSVPGSLIGMLLLLGLLATGIVPVRWFEAGGERLLTLMPLLLVPSMAGLMEYGPFLLKKGGGLLLTAVISTLLIIIVAGHTGQYLAKRRERK
ncbi:CidA/LrgA family holin-like protein [Ectobacillus ponti]|uniref:CidA/LrgA family holin-like protein n=1 Tax=Ectobacillus ponti TaxID=2961894 RepID=A0AA41X771_9BACI|nr:CidA/LrgA family holin-like protein [Ectobacillus ponti]MCP8969997.1 CidA/LrgA family holin-like protein [Ectobacillus ponti]